MRTFRTAPASLRVACLAAGLLVGAPALATVGWGGAPDPSLPPAPMASTAWLPMAFRCCPLSAAGGIDLVTWRLGDPQGRSWSDALQEALPRSVADVAPVPERHYLLTIPVVVFAGLLAGALRHTRRGR
jgi:hypothetical protein